MAAVNFIEKDTGVCRRGVKTIEERSAPSTSTVRNPKYFNTSKNIIFEAFEQSPEIKLNLKLIYPQRFLKL
jgi:hypothetical protein